MGDLLCKSWQKRLRGYTYIWAASVSLGTVWLLCEEQQWAPGCRKNVGKWDLPSSPVPNLVQNRSLQQDIERFYFYSLFSNYSFLREYRAAMLRFFFFPEGEKTQRCSFLLLISNIIENRLQLQPLHLRNTCRLKIQPIAFPELKTAVRSGEKCWGATT